MIMSKINSVFKFDSEFPEQARNIQHCINAHEKCREKEVLKNELKVKNDASNRFIVNTEYVQNLDKSDGSKPYDLEYH